MARVLTLHDGEQVMIRRSTPELLEMQAEWKPAGPDHKPPFHFHPLQDEHFEINEGELTVKRASPGVVKVTTTLLPTGSPVARSAPQRGHPTTATSRAVTPARAAT